MEVIYGYKVMDYRPVVRFTSVGFSEPVYQTTLKTNWLNVGKVFGLLFASSVAWAGVCGLLHIPLTFGMLSGMLVGVTVMGYGMTKWDTFGQAREN